MDSLSVHRHCLWLCQQTPWSWAKTTNSLSAICPGCVNRLSEDWIEELTFLLHFFTKKGSHIVYVTSFAQLFLLKVRNGDKAQLLHLHPLDNSFCLSAPQFLHLLNTGTLLWDGPAKKVLHEPASLFLMHFTTKFSSSLSEIVWKGSFHRIELVFDTPAAHPGPH